MDEKRWDEYAEDYHTEVISPFQKDVKNPLKEELLNLTHRKNKTLAEFGCGRFELGNFLSENFGEVFAFDFSEKMVEKAKGNNHFPNTTIEKIDTTKMNFYEKFEVAVSVNSIIMPSFNDIKKALDNIYKSLKENGTFFLIVPSMESVIYDGLLVLNRELKKSEEKKAVKDTKEIAEDKKYDYLLGYYMDTGDVQKFYYKFEIRYLLEKSGFKEINFQKVEYPWKKTISDFENFPKEKPLWDWFVKCQK